MSKIENTLAKTPELVLNQKSMSKLLNEAWDLRNSPQPIVPFLRGAPGIGKTQLVYAWAKEMQKKYPDFVVCDFMLADKYPSDLVAQVPNHETHMLSGYINETLAWSIQPDAYGIIFFDEMTQAPPDTTKVVSKAINERKFGSVPISENVLIVIAGNRATDKAGASKMFSMIANRVDTYDCVPDVEGIIDYMVDRGYNPLIPAYMNSAPYEEARDFQPNDASFYSHRSMERVAQKWTHRDPDGTKGVVMSLMDVSASIGIGRAREFVAFVEMVDKLPSRQEVILNPEKCKVPEKLDERCAMACMLSISATDKTFPAYSTYVKRLPVSLQILFLKLTLKRDTDSVVRRTREFTTWILEKEIKDAILDRTA